MNVEIERLSFFRAMRGRIRWAEHEPSGSGREHVECGCTKNVDERPVGEPVGVQVLPRLSFVHDGRLFRYESDTGFWIYPEKGPYCADAPHAYFWLHGQDKLQVEIVRRPWRERVRSPSHSFLAELYRGNGVDTSCFFNGHSPTRLDLSWVKPGTLWVHACTGGCEAAEALQEDQQTWNMVFDTLVVARDVVTPQGDLRSVDLGALRARIEADKALEAKLVECATLLGDTISGLERTELFRVGVATGQRALSLYRQRYP